MSFPAYPAYKDTGAEWLGPVPEHWKVGPFKQLVNIQNGADHKLVEREDGYPVIGSGGLFAYASEYLYDGESVLLGRKGTIDKPLYVNEKFWTVDTMYWSKIEPGISGKFAYYSALNIPFDYYSTNTALPSMTKGVLGMHSVTWPSFSEQVAIASFLDKQTSKIDALIHEQERLVELMREKRQAMISHAITRGLSSDVVLSDSGDSFLGQVPAHWIVKRIKHLIESLEQGWSPQCEGYPVESDNDWGVLKVGCVNGGVFSPKENKTLPSDLTPIPSLGVLAGDLMISRANTRELVGSAAVALQDYPRLLLCDKLYRLRLFLDVCDSAFLSYFLGTDLARSQIELGASGASSSMKNISQSTILEMPIALPPLLEQRSIVESINHHVTTSNALIQEADSAIALLREHLAAVISAAVTGKIDVRGLA